MISLRWSGNAARAENATPDSARAPSPPMPGAYRPPPGRQLIGRPPPTNEDFNAFGLAHSASR